MPGFGTEQVLLLQILGQELSCCLQETQLLPRPAKLLLRNALDPELRCCLQDCADAVSDHAASAAGDSGQPLRDVPCGNAPSNPDGRLAIFGGYRGKHRGTQDRRQSSGGGIQKRRNPLAGGIVNPGRFAESLQPYQPGLSAKPGNLPLGVLARIALCPKQRLAPIQLGVNQLQSLFVPMRFKGLYRGRYVAEIARDSVSFAREMCSLAD